MNELQALTIESIWQNASSMRLQMAKRKEYYLGNQDIVGRNQIYVDGSSKAEIVSNFIRFGVDLYTGSIAGRPYNISQLENDEDSDTEYSGAEAYREIGTNNNFDAIDVANLRNALICGYSVELHEFIDGQIVITERDPIAWLPIYNSNAEMIGIINRSTVYGGEFFGNELLNDKLEIMVLYTADRMKTWHKDMSTRAKEWVLVEDVPHYYGKPPVVIWRTNKDKTSIISDDLITQQDEYNDIDSASGDSLRYDTDGVLAIKGYSQKNIQDNAEQIREFKLLPLPENGDAYFISKGTDSSRIESRLARTRQHIFMTMAVPDIEDIVGATGSTSGIALKLKFKPMQDNAAYMISNLRQGVRSRIELINAVIGRIQDSKRIENVQVNIDFALPTNRVEEWQNIGSLSGIVSHRKQLEVLTDVVDVDQEERRLSKESEDAQFIARTDGTPGEIQARSEAQINANAELIQPQISTVIDSITDAVLSETLRRSRPETRNNS